ncbi:unnamed protein product [Gongylonema pulchrum]|uniref:Arrestin_C domain-containing protein n=2 Tax=Gongylonema pulchrum TaxID=637853 RepID=A0A183DVJ9_9BILA|nr:unnamed protein product [Gongylonema pulchrum]
MSLFNQMKLSVAKALQFSTDGNIFEIPECAVLSTTDKISIKVANITQMYMLALRISASHKIQIKATVDYMEHNTAIFNIRFLVRDERRNKKTVMSADLRSGMLKEVRIHNNNDLPQNEMMLRHGICSGFEVKSASGVHVMDVKLPNNNATCIGKIVHPFNTTIYKVTDIR